MLVIVAVLPGYAGRAGNGGGESLRISPSAGMRVPLLAIALAVAPLAAEDAYLRRLGDSCSVYSVCSGES
jgi:hypothetical protein